MELKHILKEMDETDRRKRQVLNPLTDLTALRVLPNYYVTPIFDKLHEASLNESLQVIWENNQAWQDRMREAMPPLHNLQPTLQQKAMELYDAMSPLRAMAAAAMENAERIHQAMQPLRDAVRNLHQHAELMSTMKPACQFFQDTYAHRLISDTREMTRFITESSILVEARALELHGPNLADALSRVPDLNQNWLSAVGRFDAPTLDIFGPAVAIPSREGLRSFKETRIVIGRDEDEEPTERPGLPEMEELIAEVSVELLPSYRGAVKRANDVDDDYQRQAVVSIRIFVQALLVKMASDQECARYLMATEGKVIVGSPSWALRLCAAYASFGQPELTTAMKNRGQIMRYNMEVLQETVHVLPELHSHDQFQHFFNNALASIKSILEVFHLARRGR